MDKKKWDIYLIMHSHTDIGYTARQEKIMRMHADFIRQAMAILDSGQHPGFKWQCENFWQVENFIHRASEAEVKRFESYIQAGSIGLSAVYLNMTELVDASVMEQALARARAYAERLGVKLASGMIADINGLSWGSVEQFNQAGMRNLYSCLHSHHGMFPIGMKQRPFFWEGASGERLLVWNGEHYHFGNELHFAPGAGTSYMIQDEQVQLTRPAVAPLSAEALEEVEFEIMVKRLRRYFANIEKEAYPWSFMPFMVSGSITDNAPPSGAIADRIAKLNALYPDEFNVQLASLDQFFDRLREVEDEIPVYRGDWPDWWADGIGSTPKAVSTYKEAQRHYQLYNKVLADPDVTESPYAAAQIKEAEKNMLLFAEHTWGYSASISEPWSPETRVLDQKKQALATNAHTAVFEAYDQLLESLGERSIRHRAKQRFQVINPHDAIHHGYARLEIEHWDSVEGQLFQANMPLEIYCEERQSYLPYQVERAARAFRILVPLVMQAREKLILEIRPARQKVNSTALNHAYIGADGVADIDHPGESTLYHARTDYFELEFDPTEGWTGLIDRISGERLSLPGSQPFLGVYEHTDGHSSQTGTRRQMGRNRKSPASQRHQAKLSNLETVEKGPVFTTWKLSYQLVGTTFWEVYLRAYQELPRIELSLRFHKTSTWDPENLYLSLPFTAGQGTELWMDKTAAVLRPGIDQLPATNQEFWLGQNGYAWIGEERQLLLASKDAPLLTLGTLEPRAIQLSSGENRALNQAPAWSWLMNNFWETNFKADLGGFYQFDYLLTTDSATEAARALETVAELGQGLVVFHI